MLKQIKLGNKGITLVALIITIIVLLILAGVTITSLFGQSGIITRSNQAKEDYNLQKGKEDIELILFGDLIDKYLTDRDKKYTLEEIAIVLEQEGYDVNSEGDVLIVVNPEDYEYEISIDDKGNVIIDPIGKSDGQPRPQVTAVVITQDDGNNSEVVIEIKAQESKNGIVKIEIDGAQIGSYNNEKGEILEELIVSQNRVYVIKVTSSIGKIKTLRVMVNHINMISFSQIEWVNEYARVKIDGGDNNYSIKYAINDINSQWINYQKESYINNLQHEDIIYARLYEGQKQVGGTGSVQVLDQILPEDFTIQVSDKKDYEFKVTVNEAVDNQSGIKEYEYFVKKPEQGDNEYVSKGTTIYPLNNKVITGLEDRTEYNVMVIVRDNAGNEKVSPVILGNTEWESTAISDLVESNKIKIGDYVAYSPAPGSFEWTSANQSNIGSGNNKGTITTEALNWRVLDIKDGQVRLISEIPTTTIVYIAYENGYNNGVYLLDYICSSLYTKAGVSTARNLKIEDIEDKMKEKDLTNIDSNYKSPYILTASKTYPTIWKSEVGSVINGVSQGGTLGLSEQSATIQGTVQAQTSITPMHTSWSKNFTAENASMDWEDVMYYTLFINNGSNYKSYWLSSRCVGLFNSTDAAFSIRRVMNSSTVSATSLYVSSSYSKGSGNQGLRPVVILNADIEIDITDFINDGKTSNKAWKIKE